MKSSLSYSVSQLFWCEQLEKDQSGFNIPYERWLLINHRGGQEAVLPEDLFRKINPAGQAAIVSFCSVQGEYKVTDAAPLMFPLVKAEFISHLEVCQETEHLELQLLWQLYECIHAEPLRQCYLNVLTDPQIYPRFYHAVASDQYHHSELGGLLRHSIEVAMLGLKIADQLKLSAYEKEIILVAGIFHDIGKIMLYQNDKTTGIQGQHESLTFAVLGQHFKALQQAAPSKFEALSQCLSARFNDRDASYICEQIVRIADRLSAEVEHHRFSFKSLPDYFYFCVEQGNSGKKRILKRLLS